MACQHFAATCVYCPEWRTCFVGVTSKHRDITNRVLKLTLPNSDTLYVSAITANEESRSGWADGSTVQLVLNPGFACMQGIADGAEVYVELVATDTVPRCSSLSLQTLDNEHWSLTQLHATKIEWILQDHIRVLQPGQSFIVHLHSSTCVSLKVLSIEPSYAGYVQLSRGTEVIIQPPNSSKTLIPLGDMPKNQADDATASDSWLSTLMPWLDSVSGAEAASALPRLPKCDETHTTASDSRLTSSTVQQAKKPRINPKLVVEQTITENLDQNFSSTVHSGAADQFKRLFQLACESPKLGAPFSVLICGNKGFGKSYFLGHLIPLMRRDMPALNVQRINCRQISGRRPEFIISTMESVIDTASRHEFSAILLDDLNCLCAALSQSRKTDDVDAFNLKLPNSQNIPVDNADPTDVYFDRIANVLIELQRTIRDRIQKISLIRNIVLVATTTVEAEIHPLLQSVVRSKHYFDAVITLTAPDPETRVQLVFDGLKSLVSTANCDIVPDCLSRIIRQCLYADHAAGLSVGQLHRLCEMVAHRMIIQQQPVSSATHLTVVLNECIEKLQAEKHGFSSQNAQNGFSDNQNRFSWADAEKTVAGDLLDRLRDIFELPVHFPSLVASCPIPLPRGVLLYGVPGSGKTFLCRVVADAARFRRVFFIKGPELLTKYIGASEARVRQLFADARQCRPSLIVFDEFDALAPRRGHDSTGVTDRVVNQLLAELDGMSESRGISVIATSSRPDLVDEALLRPGRIDVSLKCELPTADHRHEILLKLCAGLSFLPSTDADGSNERVIDLLRVAEKCAAFTGADLRALVYDAQMIAIRAKSSESGPDMVEADVSPPLPTKLHFEEALKAARPALSKENMERFEMNFARFARKQGRLPTDPAKPLVDVRGGEEKDGGAFQLKTSLA